MSSPQIQLSRRKKQMCKIKMNEDHQITNRKTTINNEKSIQRNFKPFVLSVSIISAGLVYFSALVVVGPHGNLKCPSDKFVADADSPFNVSNETNITSNNNYHSSSSSSENKMISIETTPIIPPIYQDDLDHCTQKNYVLRRGDESRKLTKKPFSITNYTFYSHYHGHTNNNTCNDIPSLLSSIKNGKRHWINNTKILPNTSSLTKEKYPSYFKPYQCDIPFISPHDTCNIMNHYSNIFTIGDSLTRHLRQAVLMILKKDFVLGGIQKSVKKGPDNPYKWCRCDGQFSEHKMCRRNNGFFQSFEPRDLQLCSHLPEGRQFHFDSKMNYDAMEKCGTDPRHKGVLLFLQGGIHFDSNVTLTLQKLVEPIINHPSYQKCKKVGKMTVIWQAMVTQSRQLDKRNPLLTREESILFNEEMEGRIRDLIDDVTIVEWWNVTEDAMTSDGQHFLADVNLVRANHLLNIVKLLQEEEKEKKKSLM